jgi:hypothetical protein
MEADGAEIVVEGVEGEAELRVADDGPEEVLPLFAERGTEGQGVRQVGRHGRPQPHLQERQVALLEGTRRLADDEELALVEPRLRRLRVLAVVLDLAFGDLHQRGTVAEGEQVPGVDHPHERVATHGRDVVPRLDRRLTRCAVRVVDPAAVQVEPRAEGRQVQPLDVDGTGHGQRRLGRLPDEDAPVPRVE